MKKIFVVMGTTGEYSDRHEWPVCAYSKRHMAEAHVLNAERWYRQTGIDKMQEDGAWEFPRNPYDPFMSVSYTGTSWYVTDVDLIDRFPAAALKAMRP